MNPRGFIPIVVIVAVIILLAAGGGTLLIYQKSATRQSSPPITEKTTPIPSKEKLPSTPEEPPVTREEQKPKSQSQPKQSQPTQPQSPILPCGDKKELFTALPVSLSDLTFIRPLGFIGAAPEHIYPTDHVYFFLKRGASNQAIEVPVYSPGDVWITKIKEIKMERPVPNSTDYSIYFSPCREFEGFYFHLSTVNEKIKSEIKPPFRYCHQEELGRFKQVACEKDVRIKLNAGELMGTVGQLAWQYSFDLGTYDLRTPALNYANPSRWQEWQKHIVCPFDYFRGDVKDKLKFRLGEDDVLRTIEPTCGEIEQDESGTAQGVWFSKDAKMYAQPELSLIHDFIDPKTGAFALGFLAAESGLSPDILYFIPTSSGFVNRDFKDIADDGKIYCYDQLVKQWSYDKKPEQLIILIQLTSPSTLRIQGKNVTNCGSGPWEFKSPTELER
ncbi:MAG: hypothetical protein AAB340_02995 [Patescibacteria group bacterium]